MTRVKVQCFEPSCNCLIPVEHIFELVIEGVRGLMLFDSMIWGEADCFVQYYFPAQQQSQPPGAPVIRHGMYFYCRVDVFLNV